MLCYIILYYLIAYYIIRQWWEACDRFFGPGIWSEAAPGPFVTWSLCNAQ